MTTDIQIRPIGPLQRDLLIRMYDQFDPLGAALGLPPHTPEARRNWLVSALGQIVNVAAFSPSEEIVGHCFLAADTTGGGEAAVFVHQETRRNGIGTALLQAALQRAWVAELRRVWAVSASDNRAALSLLTRCGFQVAHSASAETEWDIELHGPPAIDKEE